MKHTPPGYCDVQDVRSSLTQVDESQVDESRPEADRETQLTAALRQALPSAAPQVC